MPDNQDNNSMDNMSINDVNELFEDVIEIPDEYKFISAIPAAWSTRHSVGGMIC